MEVPRPKWSEEELSQSQIKEREASSDPVAEKPQALSFLEGEVVAEAIKKQPIVAFEHVSRAAEAGQPIEKKYETRHEVKDEPAAQQVVSIGSVIAAMPTQPPKQPEPASNIEWPLPAPLAQQSADEQSPPRSQPALYRQAIRAGFVAAIMLIVFVVLLSLII